VTRAIFVSGQQHFDHIDAWAVSQNGLFRPLWRLPTPLGKVRS